MSCWRCECGQRNCDVEDCINPRCHTRRGIAAQDAMEQLKAAGLNPEHILPDVPIIKTTPRWYDKATVIAHIAIANAYGGLDG